MTAWVWFRRANQCNGVHPASSATGGNMGHRGMRRRKTLNTSLASAHREAWVAGNSRVRVLAYVDAADTLKHRVRFVRFARTPVPVAWAATPARDMSRQPQHMPHAHRIAHPQ